MNEANSCRHVGEAEEVRNGGCEDEGDDPVEGHDAGPENLSLLRDERGSIEKLHKDIVVENFDSNIAIKCSSDQTTNNCEHVSHNLPAIGRYSLIGQLKIVVSNEDFNLTRYVLSGVQG